MLYRGPLWDLNIRFGFVRLKMIFERWLYVGLMVNCGPIVIYYSLELRQIKMFFESGLFIEPIVNYKPIITDFSEVVFIWGCGKL